MPVATPATHRGRLLALSLGVLLPSLGTSIANVALPSLASSFGASPQDAQWVVIAYLLAVTALLITAGRLGDTLGRRRLLLGGIAVFTLASAGAAVAPALWVLVATRAVQGAGAAVMMSLTVAAVGDIVPKERTGSAMGLLGTVSAMGTALGPSLGGLILGAFGWSAVFAVMALAGLAAFAVGYALLPAEQRRSGANTPLDVAGSLLLVVSLGTLALAATLSPVSPANAALAAAAAIGIAAFVAVERRTASPLIQLSLLRDGTIGSGLLSVALVSAIVMTTLVVGPFYLRGALGLDPAMTGLVMSIGPSVAALSGIPSGRLVDRLGTTRTSLGGLALVLAGSASMALLPQQFGIGFYAASIGLITAGYALFQAAVTTAVVGRSGAAQRGVSSALLALARNLGLVTGASAMGAVFAAGSNGVANLGLVAGGSGLRLTFIVAAALAGFALLATWRGREVSPGPERQRQR